MVARHHRTRALLLALVLACPAAAQAADDYPLTSPAIPASRDTPWPSGAMMLDVDASDITRGLYRVTQTIPLAPGPLETGTRELTLLLPNWLPGTHGPGNSPAEFVDLRFTADGKPLAWRRDPVEFSAFHVTLPPGASLLVARFVHSSPLQPAEGRVTMTPEMLNLQWARMSLYPAGYYVRRIPVRASVVMPAGWTPATALDGMTRQGERYFWAQTDYETLIDSPIFAGSNYRRYDLGGGVSLDAFADRPEQLAIAPANQQQLRRLVAEGQALFGAAPFRHYDFLVGLSSKLGGIGLEHQSSSEIQLEPGNFIDWAGYDWDRNTIPHEFVHAWNGKYRRPQGLATPDYRTPMQNDLLWFYEGQSQFWGMVLAARSGVQRKDTVIGAIAQRVAALGASAGRGWRSLQDTTYDPVFARRKPKPYASMARGEDYYWEGAMIWLEADQLIRKGTGGARGLDDFAREFFAYKPGSASPRTYTFADVVAALDAVYAHDWAAFLRARVDQPERAPPYAGIEAAGYRIVWREEPNSFDAALMRHRGTLSLNHSLGMEVNAQGALTSVVWDSPAFHAGLVTGTTLLGVDGEAYSAEVLKAAIRRAKGTSAPIQLVVQRGTRILTVPLDYHQGLRWPWLERAGNGDTGLDRLLAPKTK